MRKNLKTTYPGNAWFAALASLLLLVMQFGFPALSDAGPRVPKAVTLSAALSSTGSQVNLTWTSPNMIPTGFLIERSQQASSGYVQVGAASGSAISATDAPGGTTGSYYYRVRGYVTLGSKTYYSDYSNVAGVTLIATEPTDDAAPSVIISSPETDLQVNNEQTLTVIAAASDNVKVTRVDFYNGSALIGSDTTNTFSASLPLNKDNNGTHSIYAVAHDAAGNSSKSASVNVVVDIVDTVESPTTESYPAPVLDAVTVDGSNFVLKWSVPSSASGLPEGGYDLVIDGVDTGSTHRTTATTATIGGLEAGVAHTFMVEARWTQAEPDQFPRSNQVQGIIPVNAYPAPVLDAVTVDGSNFVLKWSVPSSASGLPEGGYDLVIDGVDTGSTHRTTATSATISGLEAGVAHTFMVEARWTQAEPDEFPRSNQVQGMIEASSDAGTTDTATRQPMSLRGNPSFDAAQLPEEARLWYQRLWASIENSNQYLNATTLAESNDTYNYARPLNTHITSLLHAFRMTGDLRLLDEIDRLAQIMRSKLKDWSILVLNGTTYQADGYLNWLYFYDAGYEGTDIHQMDEMLSHSLVAAFAYAFHANRDLDSRYAERATFWTGYLKNHFEAKWRKRKGIATGFPFLTKLLTHVYVQWIRYHYYMHKLTGEDGYYNEAVRLSQDIKNHMEYVGTPLGTTAQWDHGMPELGGSTLGPQPTNYARYTMQGMADLAFENFSIFDNDSLLTSVANTAAYYVLNSKAPSAIAYYIDGSGEQTDDLYVISPFTAMAYWDASGKIVNLSTQIFQNIEGDETTPRRIYVPAGLFLNAMKNK
ncbi:MAG: Ig-like domain-containing protein [Syntrophotalea sp.]|uniref:Ig-like domain-containing protein n=1 Tax=Syntrophotalea sp. TaxID=2812029 RepID=UPI003D0E1FCA